MNTIKNITKICLSGVLILALAVTGFALEEKERKIVKTAKDQITGEITRIGKNSISVLYNQDKENGIEYEMVIPIDNNVGLEHLKSLNNLKVGDQISIQYEDTVLEQSDKSEKIERKASVISFIKAAPAVNSDTLSSGSQ